MLHRLLCDCQLCHMEPPFLNRPRPTIESLRREDRKTGLTLLLHYLWLFSSTPRRLLTKQTLSHQHITLKPIQGCPSDRHTLFSDKGIISVIRVIGITDSSYQSVLIHPSSRADFPSPRASDIPCEYSNSRNSWPCIPWWPVLDINILIQYI